MTTPNDTSTTQSSHSVEQAGLAQIAQELEIAYWQAEGVLKLLDSGNTVPFIARYRKEVTGSLDEEKIRAVSERMQSFRHLQQRKVEVEKALREMGQWSEGLSQELHHASSLREVEDLYLPYRPKRKTRAGTAKEMGLEPLADWLLSGVTEEPLKQAERYLRPKEGLASPEQALQGAKDILAERFAETPLVRQALRKRLKSSGQVQTVLKEGASSESAGVYTMYFSFQEAVRRIRPHQVLAINRAEREEVLTVKLTADDETVIAELQRAFLRQYGLKPSTSPSSDNGALAHTCDALTDGYRRLLFPSIAREIRQELAERAEEQAIEVFGENLKHLLLQPPLRGYGILGVDPGFRTGCKLAAIDEAGKLLETGVIYPHPPQNQRQSAAQTVKEWLVRHQLAVIAIGNGTASRETESFIAELLAHTDWSFSFAQGLPAYAVVSEAGASVYSASPAAKDEFPQLDVTERSAVSIARRLLDPLAELVKIEPRSIGVGQYQHDVNQIRLSEQLDAVVEDAVNRVGVELNTASVSLLRHVAGINRKVAQAIVDMRNEQGAFTRRSQLLSVTGLGAKTFQQCAGFLRIAHGAEPLDATAVHPESYDFATSLLAAAGLQRSTWWQASEKQKRESLLHLDVQRLASEWQVGLPTLQDILDSLLKPGRDPRDDVPKPILRQDVLTLEDLTPGMILQGTVRNVVDFGAFVDIGVKSDGLVHISQLANDYVRHPSERVAVGDIVQVRILNVDFQRQRVSLSMLLS